MSLPDSPNPDRRLAADPNDGWPDFRVYAASMVLILLAMVLFATPVGPLGILVGIAGVVVGFKGEQIREWWRRG